MRLPKLNMLKAKPAVDPHRGWRRAVWAVAVIFSVLVVVAAMAGFALYPYVRSAQAAVLHVESGRELLAEAEIAAGRLDLPVALDRLRAAESEFLAAQEGIARLRDFERLPWVGPRVVAADGLLSGGLDAVTAVRSVLESVEVVMASVGLGEDLSGDIGSIVGDPTVPFRDLGPEEKSAILEALAATAVRIDDAVARLDRALLAIESTDAGLLGGDLPATLDRYAVRIEALRDSLEAVRPVARHLPDLLGHGEPRHYLLFFQNNTEMRPTGGFLGVYGTLEVSEADIVSLQTDDIYALDGPSESVDRPEPPEPIRRYVGVDKWYLRDANWSPDFPTSVEVMRRFYREEAAVAGREAGPVHGIVAFSPEIARDVLRLVGPVEVQGKTFDADNLVDQLEFEVERNFRTEGIPFFARKQIVGDLARETVDRLLSLSLVEMMGALALLEENLEEGHVLFWFGDPDLQSVALEHDWAGAQRLPVRDYVSVYDANLAALKTDHAMERSIRYALRPDGDGYEARVAVTYVNNGSFDWKTTRYRTYTRLYAPPGSRLVRVDGAMYDDRLKDPAGRPGVPDEYDERGYRVFGAFISVEPGKTGTLEFVYRLDPKVAREIESGEYGLYFEKQPGTVGHGLTLDLDFGKNLKNADPPEPSSEWGDSRFRYVTDLAVDRSFEVSF